MAHYRVSKRYAKGFMDYLEDSNVEKSMQEMVELKSLLSENRDLRNFFYSPILDHKKKSAITQEIFKDYSTETQHFLLLVISHQRSHALIDIVDEFVKLYRIKNGIKKVVITSAHPMSDAQMQKIIDSANITSNKTEVENKVKPDLIGGFVLRVEDQQYDASVQSKLDNLKKNFDIKHYIPQF